MLDTLIVAGMRHPKLSAACSVVAIVFLGSFLWWRVAWEQPQRVFADMLANNLETPSVTKMEYAASNGQSVSQSVRLQMGSTNAADWLVSATAANSAVTTESLGTPKTGFIRYTHIATSMKRQKPSLFDGVVNVWAKADGKTDPSLLHVWSQTLLDLSSAPLPPIANLPYAERQTLLQYIRSERIFAPSYTTAKRQVVNGKDVYTYSVSVQLGAYIRLMQAFAHDLSLTDLDTVDPNQYSTVPPITLSVSVDRASHQLVRITYPGSTFSQSYTNWGIISPLVLPQHTLTTTQLQTRIQSLRIGS